MGFIGFGNKEVFEREPKKAFKKAKKVYGNMMEDYPNSDVSNSQTDYDEIEELKERRRNAGRIRSWIMTMIVVLGLMLLVFLIFSWMGDRLDH